MANGRAALDAQIRRLRELEHLVPDAAPAVAKAVEEDIRGNIARGVGPDGTALQRTKEGKQPLRNAAKAISVRALGTVVVITVSGVEARHHLGAVKGKVKRPLIPSDRVPDPMVRAIDRVLSARFTKIMGGA